MIDIAKTLGAVTREVAPRSHEGKDCRVVISQRDYDTDPADLWDALTNAERIPRWFMPVTGDLKLGGRFQVQGNAGGVIRKCEPPRLLDVTWEFGGKVSWLSLALVETSGATRLTLEHIVLADDHWDQFGPGAVGVGWDGALMGLGEHFNKAGAAVVPEQAMAWMTSDEGKSFFRESAARWGDAHVASGEDAVTARAMAQRTAVAYTGEGDAQEAPKPKMKS